MTTMSPSSILCPNCQSDISSLQASARICPYCGHKLPVTEPEPAPTPEPLPPPPPEKKEQLRGLADLRIRIVATLIDLIVFLGSFALIRNVLTALFLYWTYATLTECSAQQATFGKRLQGLRVTDLKGNGISLVRAAERNFVKLGSCFLACIPSSFTPQRRGLHDLIAGTLVQVSDKVQINLLAESRSRLGHMFSNKTKK